ncbi:RNA polymerase sigma factor [Paenibacillus ehimensis]|uniref:RNA polymerase sigma factor n=1 Tax=Paenibacillus ehimensis TaxID=79264 RepID=A0ABT8VBC7_9BACL|nr:sigma-70 family RNA polymerase sigma factor [Paenibacillus ehimensis]MDO3678265.1 sigma-70 family RNA polymerase sigma factor [Paenibacillus ehimensis]MEC0210310.1 sigma-70 family RNA polymerase sigma factor [Paenibacillus ehimensis]
MYDPITKIYLLYYDDLYRFLVTRYPNPDHVDDIIQNTFLEALRHMDSFKGGSSLKTWLFGIAKHQLYRSLRKNKIQLSLDDSPGSELAAHTDFSDKVLAEQILERLDRLDPPHREIMGLRLLHGLSFKEIAQLTDRTETYCRVNFYRMKEKLRKEYGEDEHM